MSHAVVVLVLASPVEFNVPDRARVGLIGFEGKRGSDRSLLARPNDYQNSNNDNHVTTGDITDQKTNGNGHANINDDDTSVDTGKTSYVQQLAPLFPPATAAPLRHTLGALQRRSGGSGGALVGTFRPLA